ncbi:MAG: dihydrolipoamide acetyltransferase family protein [Pseudomonadota bacterium]|nr:dihydrolipoamide acetyltransferase family protein [Pseudomonadota bacterium]
MNIFTLPDLGEGLQEAELLEWLVGPGETVEEDQNLVSVETAKAIIDIPCPVSGRVLRLYGEAGDVVHVGDPLVEFASDSDALETDRPESPAEKDTGSVVGRVETGPTVLRETAAAKPGTGIRVSPAVRALARRLEVDLSVVTPTGPGGAISNADVQRVAGILKEVGPLEPLRGVRRAMSLSMSKAHAEVVAVTVCDDADIHAWGPDQDVTLRLIRALVAGCRAEPSLNAWYDSHSLGRRLIDKIDLGIAVDTPDGLFVPVLRDVAGRSPEELRTDADALKEAVRSRRIPPADLRGNTISLSNFGNFGGRYANPVVVPPTVAILGAGRVRDAVVAADAKPAVHRVLPLSLSFDHRAVTGGEATRFLAVVIEDLSRSE